MITTQAEIIRMAREAGIQGMCTDVICTFDELTKFAQLVAEAERAAQQAAQAENADLKERLARSGVEMRKTVRDEREACANICDALDAEVDKYPAACATAIRARGQADTNMKGAHE